jgi:hypothetical protein
MPKVKMAKPELSPARHRLADLQRQRADALAAIATENANSNRLERFHAAVEPARAELAAFDAQNAVAMSNWSRGLVTGLPKPDSAHRAELASDLADAEQASAAAKIAQEQFQAAAERAGRPLQRLDLEIRKQAKIVAIEEATKLLPEITEAIATAETLRNRLEAARAEVMSGVEWGSTEFSEVGAALHSFENARGLAQARPIQTTDFAADWRKFTAALTQAAEISFEEAGAFELPSTPFSPSAPDLATAAMLAAAAFPSNGIQR